MRTPLKLDISTGDVITPQEVSYEFKLMFEDRTIHVLAYNLETVLAEKLESVLSHGYANTRMRDFYDLHILQHAVPVSIDSVSLQAAFTATCAKRGTTFSHEEGTLILREVRQNGDTQKLWRNYQKKYSYAADLSWDTVMDSAAALYNKAAAGQ